MSELKNKLSDINGKSRLDLIVSSVHMYDEIQKAISSLEEIKLFLQEKNGSKLGMAAYTEFTQGNSESTRYETQTKLHYVILIGAIKELELQKEFTKAILNSYLKEPLDE